MRHFICMRTAPVTPASHALGVFVPAQTAALTSACQPHVGGVDACAQSSRQRSNAGPDHSGCTPRPEHDSRRTRTYGQARRVQHPTWALRANRDVLDDHRPTVPQSRRTRVKHSEGCSARIELPRQGRRCARLLPGMGAITAHWPMAHQRRHNPKLKCRNHGRGPRASSMIWFLGQSSSRKKALLTVRKERFLAVVHTGASVP